MNSIRRRLATGLLVGLLLLLGAGAVSLYVFMRKSLYHDLDQRLLVEARALTTVTKQEETYIAVGYTDDRIVDFDDKTPTRYYQISHPDGSIVKRSKFLPENLLSARLGTFQQPAVWNLKLPGARPGRAVGVRFVPDVDSTDRRHYDPKLTLGLVVAGDRTQLEKTLGVLRYSLAAGVSTISIAVIGLVISVLARSLRPLDSLAVRAANIDVDSLNMRFPMRDLPAELQPITARMNQLLDRLQESFERERQFSSDIAHELRTPVAELRALSDVVTKWPDQVESDTFDDLAAIAQQMQYIVDTLLTLRRSEQFNEADESELVALRPLLEQQIESRTSQTVARDIRFRLTVPGDLRWEGRRAALTMIISNLLDNAVQYTPADRHVDVTGIDDQGCAVLRLTNVVDDFSQTDVAKLFDRFWRKNGVRANGNHLGLGLSICRSLAIANGWSLTARLQDGKLTLQLAEAKQPVLENCLLTPSMAAE